MALTCAASAAAQPVPITVGETHTLASKPLAQERVVNVYLPADYATSAKTYPVLYLIDGGLDQDFLHIAGTSALGALWARSQDVIVVGIATKDRRRELTGPTQDAALIKEFPTAGGSAAFRAFIRDEVMPMVAKSYRTSGETGVIGESLAGLFIVETYLNEPDLFDHYAAISPSLWWDDERLAKASAALLVKPSAKPHRLYLTIANEGREMQTGLDRLTAALGASSRSGQSWCYAPRPDLTHATIYHTVSPEALQYLFPTAVEQDPKSGFDLSCQSPKS
ncbi:alpha/beta hydrolase [Blastomonas sp. AAP25]|uniref:alpha/beta hydrolase n=1 Tax=Blastomonas sp. AAP25 TaxID=1523416 RepID=UPI0006B9E2D6|nr:alpha/beta hydrolase-fold protein [Blastomonas sp. AAP25]KPF75081.1 alpha/beta hydrolase [Blastomonas sp. AAP25]